MSQPEFGGELMVHLPGNDCVASDVESRLDDFVWMKDLVGKKSSALVLDKCIRGTSAIWGHFLVAVSTKGLFFGSPSC